MGFKSDIRHGALRLCEVKGCNKLPTFGSTEEARARRCARHKLPQHADVKNPLCIIELGDGKICNCRASWADPSDLRYVSIV